MKLSFQTLGISAFAYLALTLSTVAQDGSPNSAGSSAQETAYRSSLAEENVRKQTEKIQSEINRLVTELKLNGMENGNLKALSDASENLNSLSREDMQKVINTLQNASLNVPDQDRQQNLVDAYKGQNQISLSLKSLAAQLAAAEAEKAIPSKLENLIARQSANIRQTSVLSAAGQTVDQLNPQQKRTHDVISSEQTSIGGEIDLLFKILAAAPLAPRIIEGSTDAPDSSKSILDSMNGNSLKDVTSSASQLTLAGPFPDAVTKQKSVRDYLTSALRVSLENMDPALRLEHVRDQLRQVLGDQTNLTSVTKQSKIDGASLAERQAKINDQTFVIQALLRPINASAYNEVDLAEKAMDQSSSKLSNTPNAADAAPQEQTAVDDLQKADALLDQQIAAEQKQENLSPVDQLAQLQQLKAEIDQAQKNPQVTAADLQKLQQDAMPASPQAADKVADAADKLQQPQPDPPAADQLLAQASAIVQQQEDALQQSAQAYQALNQASQQLSQAQQQAAAANQSIQSSTNSNLTAAAHDLTQAQANVDQANQASNQQTDPQAGIPADAKQALQEASDALKSATMQAVQAQGAGAHAQDQKAMAAMQKAQAGLGQAMAQIQQQSRGQGQGKGPGQGHGQGTASGAGEAPTDANSQVLKGSGAGGIAQVVGGLSSKDRDAITQYQAEKSPPEYAPLVQQYLKNLADSDKEQ